MKRKIVTVCLAAVLVIIAVAGASLAYLTDTKTAKNTFTVGNVKIDLLESSLHRENAGGANSGLMFPRKAQTTQARTRQAIPSIPMIRSKPMPESISAKTFSSSPVGPTTRCLMF